MFENIASNVKKFQKQIKYFASVVSWLADALGSFPIYPKDNGEGSPENHK
jgi:hypothetical protein